MEIEIRNLEAYTVVEATNPVKVNIDIFRGCAPPFIGTTEEEFFEYYTNIDYIDEFIDENEDVLGEDLCNKLYAMHYMEEKNVISDSRNKFGDIWTEYGNTNPEYRKNGEFETLGSTNY